MNPDRRDPVQRAALIQAIVTHVVQSPTAQFTIETVQQLLEVAPEIADRILRRLESAGLLQQTRRGVWVKLIPGPHLSPGIF